MQDPDYWCFLSLKKVVHVAARVSEQASSIAGSRQGFGKWLAQQLGPFFRNVKWPQVGVESLRIKNGELAAHMVGEPVARRVSSVDLTLRLSNNYADMVLDVSGASTFRMQRETVRS